MALSSSLAEAIESNPALKARIESVAARFGVSFETAANRFAQEMERRSGKQKALPAPGIEAGPVSEELAQLPAAPAAGAGATPPPATLPETLPKTRAPGTESLGPEYEAATGPSGMPEGASLKDLVSANKGKIAAGGAAMGAGFVGEEPSEPEKLQLPESVIRQMTETVKSKQVPAKEEPEAPKTVAPKAKIPPTPKGAVDKAAAPKEPVESPTQAIINRYENSIKSGQAEVQKTMGTRLDALKDLEAEYRQEAKQAKSDTELKELAETMGHAFAQFGAGLQGLKTGIDMSSGLKFSKTDWNKRYELALDELKSNLADLREKRQTLAAEGREQLRDVERRGERGMGLEVRGQELKEAEAAKASAEASRRAWEEKQKQLDRDTRIELANIRTSAAQSAALQKLDAKKKEEADVALNNLASSFIDYQTGDKDEKKLAVKEYAKHKQTINALLGDGGKTVAEMEAKLKDVPFFTGTEEYLAKEAPAQTAAISKKLQAQRPAAPTAAPAPTAQVSRVTPQMIQDYKRKNPQHQNLPDAQIRASLEKRLAGGTP